MSAGTSEISPTAGPGARAARASFLRARLGSFLAVMPLSVWVVVHLWHNLSAFKGGAAWQEDVTEYGHPFAFFAASLVALLPLVLHTIWGIGRIVSAQPNNVKYKLFGNLRYTLQRLTALGVLAFVGAHLWLAYLHPHIATGRPEPFVDITHEMRTHTPTLIVYLLGTLGVTYHLANGLQGFAMGWGLVTSQRALRKLDVATISLFLVLLAMAWGSIYALWDAGS